MFFKIKKIFLLFSLILFISFCSSVNSIASELNWKNKNFKYYANNDDLKSMLISFASSYGISASISELITDKVTGNFEYKNPKVFLESISSLHNLTWYYDGAILHVYKTSETKTALLRLNRVDITDLKITLESAGVWDNRFTWRPLKGKRGVFIAGPPRYIELTQQITEVLEKHASDQLERTDNFFIELIPLKYASAIDRDVSYRGQKIIIPGVASVLDDILSGISTRVEVSNNSDDNSSKPVLYNAIVKAEPALNAIIIRDTKDRIPIYKNLIAKLDKPQTQIEVGLSIVDINVNNLKQIGIDWQGGIDLGTNKIIDFNSTGDRGSIGKLGNGLDFSSVLDQTNLNYLIAKINLLQTEGSAQIVSRPMLLTQENVEAVLSTSETFYIKLVGVESQALEEVTSGMVFKIIPRIVGDRYSDSPEINISLQIEDGSRVTDNDVDGLPTTRKTEMSTLATVKQGQSLLIGGVYRDEISQHLRKVPLLGDIPFLGKLFTSEVNTKRRTVRLFIVEPRIVSESLGRNIVITDDIDLKETFLNVESLSNTDSHFRQMIKNYSCQNVENALDEQQKLLVQGYSSSRHFCYLPTGQAGVRVILGECNSSDPGCFRPLER